MRAAAEAALGDRPNFRSIPGSAEETGLPVHLAEDPLSAVAEGTGRALNELKFLRQVATSDRQWNH